MSFHRIKAAALAIAALASVSQARAATGAGADSGSRESTVRLLPLYEAKVREAAARAPQPAASPTPGAPPTAGGFDELSISAGDETYVARSSEKSGSMNYNEVSARVRGSTIGPVFSAAIDAGGSIAANVSNYSNVEVPEAYFTLAAPFAAPVAKPVTKPGTKPEPKIEAKLEAKEQPGPTVFARLSAGRKRERWSGVDSDWSLNLVQPFNKFDALRPTEQGLTGFFGEAGVGPVSVLLFGSPLYIPEQGAPYTLSNGTFSTPSNWFSIPPTELYFNNTIRPVYYTINLPATSDVITHTSLGARLRIADPSGEGFYLQGFALRSPQNSIALSFTGTLALRDGTTFGDVNVMPEVVYHTVAGGDLGYASKNFAAEVSVLNENPDQPTLTPELTTSHFSQMTIWSPSVEFKIAPSRLWGPRVRASYIDTKGGEVTAVGQYASNGNVFGPRTMVRRAMSLAAETTLYRSSSWSLAISGRWIEEFAEQGSVLMTDAHLGIGQSWRVSLQGDLLGSRQPTSVTDTFISRFRANDRIAGRVTYLF